jgi:DNA segregation ATPase FtsK/SpoIIIE, S-DNA-T family
VKIEGIRGKTDYQKTRFVSPIFGRTVKDVVTVPFTIRDTGDTTKRFDAFRTKPKLSEAEAKAKHGNKYYEFTNIISHKTRTEYFGESSYVHKEEEVVKSEAKSPKLKPIGNKVKKTFFEPVEEKPYEEKPKQRQVYVSPPIEEVKKEPMNHLLKHT